MIRREFITLVGGAVMSCPMVARAQNACGGFLGNVSAIRSQSLLVAAFYVSTPRPL